MAASSFKLNTGKEIPALGLGTLRSYTASHSSFR